MGFWPACRGRAPRWVPWWWWCSPSVPPAPTAPSPAAQLANCQPKCLYKCELAYATDNIRSPSGHQYIFHILEYCSDGGITYFNIMYVWVKKKIENSFLSPLLTFRDQCWFISGSILPLKVHMANLLNLTCTYFLMMQLASINLCLCSIFVIFKPKFKWGWEWPHAFCFHPCILYS